MGKDAEMVGEVRDRVRFTSVAAVLVVLARRAVAEQGGLFRLDDLIDHSQEQFVKRSDERLGGPQNANGLPDEYHPMENNDRREYPEPLVLIILAVSGR